VIVNGEKEPRHTSEAFDYVIVGSGAAGATAARVFADHTASVAVVEEGPAVETRDFGDRAFPGLRRMMRDAGSQLARGRTFIPVLQGSCLGGSTTINSAIIWRLPEDVWAGWAEEHGLGEALPLAALSDQWDTIERELSTIPTEEAVWGGHNRLMHVGAEKLGVRAHPTRRATAGCRGSGRCLTGCPHGAKQSMLVTYLPYAERRGATLFTSARVDDVILNGRRAVAVRGHFAGGRARFHLEARKAVIVAASAIQTPDLLRRSGVRSPHLGRHFMGHPGGPMTGFFDEPVNMWAGATQGYDADHHRKDGRFKVETISLPPEIALARLPGVGRRWLDGMAEMGHAAVWAVQLRARAEGTVGGRGLLGTRIRYDLGAEDMRAFRKGLRFTAELFFAAGAREVAPGIFGLPERLRSPDELRLLDDAPLDPSRYMFILSHLFGTARMSREPSGGVVGTDFAVHGTDNLHVLDSSVFPSNIGVNPQHAIMGVAMLGARRLLERHG
jgi:choline dehydrogenase-like flavoprotein